LRRLEGGARAGRSDGQDPGGAFDHHSARFAERSGDQRDSRGRIGLGDEPHPFGAGARLAEPAPGHDQPGVPAARRRKLAVVRP
jgi:hypothetical protein